MEHPLRGRRTASSTPPDDVLTLNQLHFPVGQPDRRDAATRRTSSTRSSCPEFRVKQDAVPGPLDPDLVRGDAHRTLGDRVRRAVRARALPHEGLRDRRDARGVRQVAAGTGGAGRPRKRRRRARRDAAGAPGPSRRRRADDHVHVAAGHAAASLPPPSTCTGRPRGADVVLAQVHLLARPQGHRQAVHVLRALHAGDRRAARDAGPLPARVAGPAARVHGQARRPRGCRTGRCCPSSTTRSSRCTRRS